MAAAVAPNGMVVSPSVRRPFVRVSHTDGVIHLMKAAAAATASLSEAATAMKPSRSHAPKKTAPTGSAVVQHCSLLPLFCSIDH